MNFFKDILKSIISEDPVNQGGKRSRAIIFGLLAIVTGSFYYTKGWFWFSEEVWEVRAPGYKSVILSVFILAPLYLKGVLSLGASLTNYRAWCLGLNFYLFSLLSMQILGLDGESNFKYIILTLTLTTAWLGLRSIATLGIIAFVLTSIVSGFISPQHMGVAGFFFITFSMISFLYQVEMPFNDFLKTLRGDLLINFDRPNPQVVEKALVKVEEVDHEECQKHKKNEKFIA